MFEIGECIEFSYPTSTDVKSIESATRRLRRVQVKKIRDLVRDPLTTEEFIQRPFVSRSRWLIRGLDLDLQVWRQFYLGSTLEFAAPGSLRLAWYETGGTKPLEFVGGDFEPSVIERRRLMRVLQKLNEKQHIQGKELRVVATDLRFCGAPVQS
jgi:hypothetical protein